MPGADPGGGRWGTRPSLGRSFPIQNALFNSIQAPVTSLGSQCPPLGEILYPHLVAVAPVVGAGVRGEVSGDQLASLAPIRTSSSTSCKRHTKSARASRHPPHPNGMVLCRVAPGGRRHVGAGGGGGHRAPVTGAAAAGACCAASTIHRGRRRVRRATRLTPVWRSSCSATPD